MKNKPERLKIGLMFILIGFLGGCAAMNSGNDGQVQSYPTPVIEAQWIRNGDPIEYDGYKWYPGNDYEVLQDSEVLQMTRQLVAMIFEVLCDEHSISIGVDI